MVFYGCSGPSWVSGRRWRARTLATVRRPNVRAVFRIQVSRRLTSSRCNRRDQLDQVDQPILAVQLGFRQLSLGTVPHRLNCCDPHNPAVEPVEELSDVGSLVVMAPSRNTRGAFGSRAQIRDSSLPLPSNAYRRWLRSWIPCVDGTPLGTAAPEQQAPHRRWLAQNG